MCLIDNFEEGLIPEVILLQRYPCSSTVLGHVWRRRFEAGFQVVFRVLVALDEHSYSTRIDSEY